MTPQELRARSEQLVADVAQRSRDMLTVQLGAANIMPMSDDELLAFDLGTAMAVTQTILALQDLGVLPAMPS